MRPRCHFEKRETGIFRAKERNPPEYFRLFPRKDRMNVASASIRKGIISSIIRKDLLVEYRSKQTFISTLFFGLLVLVVGNFALTSTGGDIAVYAPGILWIAFFFSGQIFLSHALLSEKEENTI